MCSGSCANVAGVHRVAIGRGLSVLVAMFAVLLVLFGAYEHPASAAVGPETRVRVSGESIQPFVEPPRDVFAGRRWGSGGSYDSFVVATGVAADTAATACSFSGTTLVLMADGSKKPIEKIKPGDKVLATDPETGKQVAKKVTGTIKHWDRMSDLVLADGTVLRTTEDHPYWSVDDQRFERADELSAGERVLSADGRTVKVEGLEWVTGRDGWAYNLSVEGIHTYHVGSDEILVHNVCPTGRGLWTLTKGGASEIKKGGPFKTTFYKSESDGLWWTRDVTQHGRELKSTFKVYRETGKGLEWYRDADQYGDFMTNKWKGDTGRFIPWSNLRGAR